MSDQETAIQLLRHACEIYKSASYQGHNSHWDLTMSGGAGCPECIRARELREEADKLIAFVERMLKE